jgi:hypothetical protein
VLDVLVMSRCKVSGNILSQSLRYLRIEEGSFSYDRSRISAPNLVSLKLENDIGLPPLLDSMPSLVTASVAESVEQWLFGQERFSVVLAGLSSACYEYRANNAFLSGMYSHTFGNSYCYFSSARYFYPKIYL